jgi:hypothetical protein
MIRNNEVCEETNNIRLAEYKWKKEFDKVKKDRTKDLHSSIKNMIKNASITEQDKPGELCKKILSLYNSKVHGGLDIQLRSLLIKIFSSAKGGPMKSMDKVKASANTTVMVPQDFHSLAYQLRGFAHATSFFFGDKSILAIQLREFVKNIKGRHSIIYKNRIATADTFAAKILWSVDSFTQLFLKDCRKCFDQEDVNQRVINFNALNLDVSMFSFRAELPLSFHKKEVDAKENQNPSNSSNSSSSGNGKHKGEKKESNNKKIKNDNQVVGDLGEDFPREMPREQSEIHGHLHVPFATTQKGNAGAMDESTKNCTSPLLRSQTTRSRPTSSTWQNAGRNPPLNMESGRGLVVPDHAQLKIPPSPALRTPHLHQKGNPNQLLPSNPPPPYISTSLGRMENSPNCWGVNLQMKNHLSRKPKRRASMREWSMQQSY